MITISHTYMFIWENEHLLGPVHPSGVFSWEKTPTGHCSNIEADIGCESFTELFLSNIMEYGQNDIAYNEWVWVIFGNYLRKREGNINAKLMH